ARDRAFHAHILLLVKTLLVLHVPIFSTMHNQSHGFCACVIRKNELVSRIGRLEATIGEVGEVDKKVECCQNVENALKSKFDVDVDQGNHHHHSLNWRQSRMI
ncbi:unnamed protein product, partial [Musa acuminata subsp. burmannicoides]